MATYGYSAGYQGGGPQAVPSGYIEAYSQAGRNIGAGIQQIGSAIGESLARYGQSKAENEFLTQRLESLAPYLQTVAQEGNIMDKNSPESKLLGDIEKFSSMSIPQKKATLLNAEFYLDRADKAKARELQDLQIAQARGQYETTQQLGELMRYGLTMPTTQTVTEPTTEMLQPVGPVQPATMPPTAPVFDQQGYMQALERYRQQSSVAPGDTQAIQAQLAKLQPMLAERPQQFRIPSLQGGLGGGMGVSMATITENPQQVAGRILDAQRQQQVLQAQLQRAQAPQPTMPTREQFTTQPAAQQPAPQFLPPVEVTSEQTRTEAVPYESLRRNIAQFAVQQGMRPEVFAGLDRVLEIAGQRRPTTVEQIGGIGSVVRFGDKEQFVPAKEANLENILKVRGVTVDFPEFKGQANTESEAKDFREQYATNLKLREQIADLLELTKLGKTQLQTPQNKAKAQGLSRSIKATMRKEILGEGVVTDRDQEVLDSVIPDPTVLFSWPSANRTALESLLSRANSNLNVKAKAYGLQSVNPRAAQTGSTLASDPRVASIRARMSSGVITRQQAEQELRAIQ
jgi:hypothetical protein